MEKMVLKDQDIREPLFDYLEARYGKVRILEELVMGKSRADILMVTETDIIGIEIKSDADTYARLERQVKDYDLFFDRNIVVVGSTHGLHIREHVPAHWGVVTVEDAGSALDFYELRETDVNPKVKLERKLSLFWRPELYALQQMFGMPKYKEKSKTFVIGKIVEWADKGNIHPEVLQEEMCRLLFERDYTTIGEEIREYKKGEITKKLEAETDPEQQIKLMMERAVKKANFHSSLKRKF